MAKNFVFLLTAMAMSLAVFAQEQEIAKTQDELAKLPMYERLLEGDDAQKAEELKQSCEDSAKAENWSEAQKFAQELHDLRIAKQGSDHYEVTDAKQMLHRLDVLSKLTLDERTELAAANQETINWFNSINKVSMSRQPALGNVFLRPKKNFLGKITRNMPSATSPPVRSWLACPKSPNFRTVYSPSVIRSMRSKRIDIQSS